MSELPDRLRTAIGDEPVMRTVDIGGGDALVVTVAATHLYRSEGLLSDESVESFHHDVERLAVEAGRRKDSIVLESIDGERSFTLPSQVTDDVVEAMLEGVLRTTGVVEGDETVEAQFRFSDLTLVVTGAKLFKHVGAAVWNEDFEMFDYDSITDLDFEEGSVATQVVVEVQGRQHRVKVPNDRAGQVRREVQSAIFEHHGVSSLGGLREAVGVDEPGSGADAGGDSIIEPDPAAERETDWSPPADQDVTGPRGRTRGDSGADAATTDGPATPSSGSDTPLADTDVASLAERIDDLEARVERQNELLKSQKEAIEQLVKELRRGR
jgi:hypothetical protein